MSDRLDDRLERKLSSLEDLDLRRTLPNVSSPQQRTITVDDDQYLNFSSNDYLGMATDYEVSQTAHAVLERYGIGSGGSRLVCGEHPLFERLEKFLADWKGTEAALSFGSGYLTSLGVVRAVTTGRDVIFYDELSHRCLLEAVELSDAAGMEFSHNNLEELDDLLAEHRDEYDAALVVTEGIFSMDGDRAPVGDLASLTGDRDAWLMVDEAHSSGVWGPEGAGLTVEHGESIELSMGTLSKAVGGYGGFVAGSEVLREYLINRATTLIYSTGLPATTVAGNLSSLKKIRSRDDLREELKENVDRVTEAFEDREIPLPDPPSQVIPLLTGDTGSTLEAGRILEEEGLYAVPIRHPTVPRNQGRIRFSLRADHSGEDFGRLVEAVDRLDQAGLIKRSDIWSC